MNNASTAAYSPTSHLTPSVYSTVAELSTLTFNNKLNPDHSSTFTLKEQNQLCTYLLQMAEQLGKIEGADFEEGLRIISEGE